LSAIFIFLALHVIKNMDYKDRYEKLLKEHEKIVRESESLRSGDNDKNSITTVSGIRMIIAAVIRYCSKICIIQSRRQLQLQLLQVF